MTYFQVSSLAIPAVWIAAAGALFAAALFNRAVTGKKVEDWYWNGFFYYMISWKLSYIVFNFNLFVDMPLSILYFNGGPKGHVFALVVLSTYLLIFASKRFPSLYEESARFFVLFFISYKVIVGFLEKSSLEMLTNLVIMVVILLLSQKKKEVFVSNQLFQLFVLLELLMISSIGSLFSLESLTIIWMGLIVFILAIKTHKGAR